MNMYIVEYSFYDAHTTILTTAETEYDAMLNAIESMIEDGYGEFGVIDNMSTIDIESIDEAEGVYHPTSGDYNFDGILIVHRIVPDFKGTKILS